MSVTLKGLKLTGGAVTRPDGAPSYWRTVMRIDRTASTVSFSIRGTYAIFTCNAIGSDDFTVETGSENVDHVVDYGYTSVGQLIWFTDMLPSTNDHDYAVRLVSQSGDARLLHCILANVGREPGYSNRVSYVHIELADVDGPVAPFVGATYAIDVLFWKL